MILDDGGDATLLLHKGVEYETAGEVPGPDVGAERASWRSCSACSQRSAQGPTRRSGPARPRRSRASPRRRRRASSASTRWPQTGELLFPAINVNDSVTKSQVRQPLRLPPLSSIDAHLPGHRRA